MGATLQYAKVVDRDYVQEHGGLSPNLNNVVVLAGEEPGNARDFLVMRAWKDVSGGFEEAWRIEDPHGRQVYAGTPRTVLAEDQDVYDEVQGVRFDYSDSGFQLVLEVDGREVARVDFDVAPSDQGTPPSP